ncbi:sugar ABC transporter ATP-binding protein [Frondihabitans cladoniiphilus]|uniref:Sugar ABC transporter ATP-binding protein n=1 Tax=Frondihabitans cladoniiphilus TaxID=715785 RepID=A0ABP8VKA1_9MICO
MSTTDAATEFVADVRDVSKQYPNVQALSRADFQVRPGEVRALLGKNGAGKSTMIRLLSGAEAPDSGEVYLGGTLLGSGGIDGARALGVRTVYQELSLIPSMTIAENMFMGRWLRNGTGIDYRAMAAETERALDRLGLSFRPQQTVSELGIADQQMIEIARALKDDLKLLILDEPTSSLSASEVTRVLAVVDQLSREGVSVVYVSHRLSEIRRVASTASVMRDGRLIDTRPIGELSTQEVVQMMLGDAAGEMDPIDQAPPGDGAVMVSVSGLAFEPKLKRVDLDLRAGEVVGIAGILGSGRTELLQAIAGITTPDSGSIVVDGVDLAGKGNARALKHGIGLTPENRKEDGIFPLLGIDENIVVSDWKSVSVSGVLSPRKITTAARKIVAQMSIKSSSTHDELATLSGGNQQKAVIGRWLHADSKILLLDEPTRGVDIEAKAQIYGIIRELAASGRVVVFVSSELEELPAVCDRVFVLRGGEIVEEFVAPQISTDTLLATAMAEH